MKSIFRHHKGVALALIAIFIGPLMFAQTQLIEPFSGELNAAQLAQADRLLGKTTTKRMRIVRIHPQFFNNSTVLVTLFKDVSVTLTAQDIGHTGIDLPNWTGTFTPTFTSGAFIVNGNRISGHVTGLQGNFEIFPMGSTGVHAVVEHKTEAFGGCASGGEQKQHEHNNPKHEDDKNRLDQQFEQDKDGNYIIPEGYSGFSGSPESNGAECFIRVLVGYTSLAQTNTTLDFNRTMIEHISLAVLESNQGYANSNVEARMELAYMYETPDDETNNACNDNDAQNDPNDGQWDELYTLRNTYDADMSCVITGGLYVTNANCNPNGGLCGRAFGFDYTDPDNMFQVSEYSCATGNFTFAHEFGHNQGLRHDNDNTGSPFSYARGYNQGPVFRTIMAVCCNPIRVNWWSNPDINYVDPNTNISYATGTATRDNARGHDVGDDDVSHHQTSPGSKSSSTTILDQHYASIFGEDDVTSSNVAESGSQLDIRSTGPIMLTTGFNAKSGSVMRAYQVSACGGVSYAKTGNNSLSSNHDVEILPEMAVFPNPFNTELTILIQEVPYTKLNLYLTDPTGRIVTFIARDITVDNGYFETRTTTSNLASGMYYLIADFDGQKEIKKIVKSE